jgi:hypothetical protein
VFCGFTFAICKGECFSYDKLPTRVYGFITESEVVNKELRRIIGPKREKVICWRNLHNRELPSLHPSLHIIRVIRSARLRTLDLQGEWGKCEMHTKFLVVKRQLASSRHRWKDDITMDPMEIRFEGVV